jgi:hypothetical protein
MESPGAFHGYQEPQARPMTVEEFRRLLQAERERRVRDLLARPAVIRCDNRE